MRGSKNEVLAGIVKNGFDYHLQVWIIDFIILDCGHQFACGCNSRLYAGKDIKLVYFDEGRS